MRKLIVAVLLCLNAGLFVALIAGVGTDKAYAQYAGADYLAVTGRSRANDAVYVIDLGTQRLVAWRLARINNKFIVTKTNRRELTRDFGR